MNQPIVRPQHGFTDDPYVAAVSAAPTLVDFEDEKTAVANRRATPPACGGGRR